MRPVISRQFFTLGAAFDTRQRIFDLMLFTLVDNVFQNRARPRKIHSSISRVGTEARYECVVDKYH